MGLRLKDQKIKEAQAEGIVQWRALEKFFKNRTFNRAAMVPVLIETSNYILKTADTSEEFVELFRLRHQVFYEELCNKSLPFPVDLDEYDIDCDHLVIKCKKTQTVVGTYRFRCSKFVNQFYSENEFDLRHLLETVQGVKLEIGRACVHPDYRKGTVNYLLWRGIIQYILESDSQYLFGCSSMTLDQPKNVHDLVQYLQANQLMDHSLKVQPKRPYPLCIQEPQVREGFDIRAVAPPLLGFYLRSGAKVLGPPAMDLDLHCVDFFTFLDLKEVKRQVYLAKQKVRAIGI